MQISIVDQPIIDIVKGEKCVDLLVIERPRSFRAFFDPESFHSVLDDYIPFFNMSEGSNVRSDAGTIEQYEEPFTSSVKLTIDARRFVYSNSDESVRKRPMQPIPVWCDAFYHSRRHNRSTTTVCLATTFVKQVNNVKTCEYGYPLREQDWSYRRYLNQMEKIRDILVVSTVAAAEYIERTYPYIIVTPMEKYIEEQIECLEKLFEGMNVEIIISDDKSYTDTMEKYPPEFKRGRVKRIIDKKYVLTLDHYLQYGGKIEAIGIQYCVYRNNLYKYKSTGKKPARKYTRKQLNKMRLEKYPLSYIKFQQYGVNVLLNAKEAVNKEKRINSLIKTVKIGIAASKSKGYTKEQVTRRIRSNLKYLFLDYIDEVYDNDSPEKLNED